MNALRGTPLVLAGAFLAMLAFEGIGAATAAKAPAVQPSRAVAPPAARRVPLRPDFTGTWALDTARSVFGEIPGGRPVERTDVIDHRDPVLRQTLFLLIPSGRDTTEYRYTTDSSRVVHRVDNRDIEARVWWEGTMLCLLSRTKLLTFEMTLGERWKLSDDRKTLTMTRRVKYPMGEGDQRLVFVRR